MSYLGARQWKSSHPTEAAAQGNLAELKALVGAGLDINAAWYYTGKSTTRKTLHQKRPLGAAVDTGNLESVLWLLEQGADPNLADKTAQGAVPLSIAVTLGKPEMVRALLEHGADPNIIFERGGLREAALGHAARADNGLEIMKLLLASGAVMRPSQQIFSYSMLAIQRRRSIQSPEYDKDLAQRLKLLHGLGDDILYSTNNRLPFMGETAWTIAVKNSDGPETVSFLLKHGAHMGNRAKQQRMFDLSEFCARADDVKTAEILLGHPDFPIQDPRRLTEDAPLMRALSSRHAPRLLGKLLELGANIHARYEQRGEWRTPLGRIIDLMAGRRDPLTPAHPLEIRLMECVSYLLENGVDPNEPVDQIAGVARSALFAAVEGNRSRSLIVALLEAGADPLCTNSNGHTVAVEALAKNDDQFVKEIVRSHAQRAALSVNTAPGRRGSGRMRL
jgi:ankyrin repeat protein